MVKMRKSGQITVLDKVLLVSGQSMIVFFHNHSDTLFKLILS